MSISSNSDDPIAADINLYRYCGNGPVNATDPSGLELNKFRDSGYWAFKGTNPSESNHQYKMSYSLEFEWGCDETDGDVATIRQPKISDSNYEGSLDSYGLSLLVVGVTISERVDVSITSKALPAPVGEIGTVVKAEVHLAWIERFSIGFNPGLGPFSFDIGAAFVDSEEVVATKDYVFVISCLQQPGQTRCGSSITIERKGSSIDRKDNGLWPIYDLDQGSGWNPPSDAQIGPAQ